MKNYVLREYYFLEAIKDLFVSNLFESFRRQFWKIIKKWVLRFLWVLFLVWKKLGKFRDYLKISFVHIFRPLKYEIL